MSHIKSYRKFVNESSLDDDEFDELLSILGVNIFMWNSISANILAKHGITKDNLSVRGSLDLSDTPITGLPDNLSVGGNLYLIGTQITELPDNLNVGGEIYRT